MWAEHFFLDRLYDCYVLTYLMFLSCVNIKRKIFKHSFSALIIVTLFIRLFLLTVMKNLTIISGSFKCTGVYCS